MMRHISPFRAVVLLFALGVNAWLLLAVAAEFASSDLAVTEKAVWNPQVASSGEKVPTAKPIDAYREILARPIFFKSREPYVPPPPPPPVIAAMPQPAVVDPGLVLGGVLIKNGVRKAYVFSRANAGAGAWISEGQDFMGWSIKSVSGAGAKLEQQGRSIDLRLYPQEQSSNQ
jgi:hypothetical protein